MNIPSYEKVKLKDIAEATGFSINTVSRVLRNIPVAEQTRLKILASAKELGYIGNSIASSMRSGMTKTIAIILGDIANPYFSRMVKSFVNFLSKNKYIVNIYNTENNIQNERKDIISAIRQRVDGILACPNEADDKNLELLKNARVPFVVFSRGTNDSSISSVRLNDIKGGMIATEFLIKQGCKNILFVNGPKSLIGSQERLVGHIQALEKRKMPFVHSNIINVPGLLSTFDSYTKEWDEITKKIMNMPDIDGIMAFSDQFLLKVLQMLHLAGFDKARLERMPIIGFDNILESFPVPLPLNSVAFAKEDMAVVSSTLLIDMINNTDFKPQQLVLDVKLYRHY